MAFTFLLQKKEPRHTEGTVTQLHTQHKQCTT